MKNLYIYLVAVFAVVTFWSCHKDSDNDTSEQITTTFTPKVYQEISGSILGYVYDENDKPIANAHVSTYSTTTSTNELGIFYISNAKMDRQGTYIKVSKNGYFLGSDIVYPLENNVAYTRIKMLKSDKSSELTGSTGGTISVLEGGKIIFPANAIANKAGSPYSGRVIVSSRFLNPNHPDMGDMMPGGLMADGANGNTYVLGTLGMIAIELHDSEGNLLNLRKEYQVTIEMPAVTHYRPDIVPFWYFDENKGRWQEEGTAVLQENKYVAKVSHFSFWNLDVPYPLIDLCGQVVYENGNPAQNINISIEVDGLGCRMGYIDNNGMFCGKVPKGKQLKISIISKVCNSVLAEIEAGPLNDDTQLNKIIIAKLNSFTVSGTLLCQNNPPEQGVIVLKIKDHIYPFACKKNGSFDLDISALVCNEGDEISVFGFDNLTNKTSSVSLLNKDNHHNIALELCDNSCPLDGKIVFDCDSTLSVQVTQGSGKYSYLWDNKSTLPYLSGQLNLYYPKTYCVTVTDISNNCSKTFCNLFSKPELGIEMSCQEGNIMAFPGGGQPPYSFRWSTGSTDKDIHVAAPGKYCVTLTDNLGCPVTRCVDFSPLTLNTIPAACSKNTYSFDSSPFKAGNFYTTGGKSGRLVYPASINVFETGFDFDISIENEDCSFYGNIKLPRLINGLKTKPIHTSCDVCNDGKIEVEFIQGAQCEQCVLGSVKIFKTSLLNEDITALNNSGKLPKGEYYIIVTDKNTECYIAFEKVKIN